MEPQLLLCKEMQELIKGYIGALETQELELRDPSSQHDSGSLDEETQWLKALRWCPRGLLDLISSKACRGGFTFTCAVHQGLATCKVPSCLTTL